MTNVIHLFLMAILGGALFLAWADGKPFYTALAPVVMRWALMGGTLIGDITTARAK